ncbi:homoserine dehydrogenase [Paracoccus panacisoli]|uniref:Homoserine dehydrogenase n=2 Tax=Paracoccus TaxID=265 RepID=A0A099G1G5_9RHOB|nr:homoserine dehydrogenase [Paracoccus sanguinis]KGJ15140.1 homoserine dehydrogenase [Paracoccus sanguinis]KGJ16664.1 homoserine dehydrogenase [Paracoccus sanguinis]KGJ19550.1 homoserine dehydrogenase [Paracoccus sanguinis]QJD18019.1 homoserine dehydrogenase [Paracoccus sanguinis]SDX40816.1 homoserine dehydrogenase [Paracoccus sanguinis]
MSDTSPPAPLRLGIAGLGTVGIGVVKIIQAHTDLLSARAGRPVVITAISARDRQKNRDADLSAYAWVDQATELATRDDVDVVVELVGGENGIAKETIELALDNGKDVVTANKALLAVHGQALAERAEANGRLIRFEAAVAGGIPVIKTITESLAGNRIRRVMGVMNGTCNYILTRMQSAGLPYETVFEEARSLGYLEADPTLDVGGIDASHKLAILATLAFGTRVAFDGVEIEGIERVSIDDINRAADMGYRIKLLGVAQMTGRGLEQRMSPCLVPCDSPLGQLEGGTNMVVIEGDAVGQIVLRGAGAGEGPTASAVMSDIIEIARGVRMPVFGQPATTLGSPQPARTAVPAAYYLRLTLADKPGALAKVASVLGDAGISIDRMRQYGHHAGEAPVLIVTHKTTPEAIDHAMQVLPKTGVITGDPVELRIEEV